MKKTASLLCGIIIFVAAASAQKTVSKKISTDLFGIFFEDISYAADGGLYAELVQNRSFEYSATDKKDWHSMTAWEYLTKGYGYGNISVETNSPLNANNPHYVVLTIEDAGQEGIGLINSGFDGIVVKAGEQYNFSLFAKQLSAQPVPLSIQLRNKKGNLIAETALTVNNSREPNVTTLRLAIMLSNFL